MTIIILSIKPCGLDFDDSLPFPFALHVRLGVAINILMAKHPYAWKASLLLHIDQLDPSLSMILLVQHSLKSRSRGLVGLFLGSSY